MSTRIPSSLKWLIDKRARLDGEIQKTRAALAKTKKLVKELSEIEKSLSAIDVALALHEIRVDTSLISPVRTQYNRINLPHGELTRLILMRLRQYKNSQPISKTEIVEFIKAKHPELFSQNETLVWLKRSVSYRLKGLYRDGILKRYHDPYPDGTEGLWSLSPEDKGTHT
jgi:hypothetical protein